jgi:glycosyltransferase involved in cell wall biosynthesis
VTLEDGGAVLHVTPYFAPAFIYGGPPRSVLGLCEALAAQHVPVHVITTSANGTSDLSSEKRAGPWPPGMAVTYLDRTFPSGRFNARGLNDTLDRLLPTASLVHVHGCWHMLSWRVTRICRARTMPYVVSPRGMLSPWSFSHHAVGKRLAYPALERHVLARAAGVHATSEGEANELRALIPNLPLTVIPNGVDRPRPTPEHVRAFREAFQIPARAPVVLYAGRLHVKKGLEVLLGAFERVGQTYPQARLVLAGAIDRDYEQAIRRLVAAHPFADRIIVTGLLERQQLNAAYGAAAVFAFPSRSENFGITVAEAMAAGLPVVVSRDTPWPELEAIGAGRFVEPSPAAFADAIEAVLASPAQGAVMGARGAAFAAARFDWPAIGAAMLEAYRTWTGGATTCR